MITAHQLAKKVSEMRRLQLEYFKGKDWKVLGRCKALEKEVDKMTEAVLAQQHPVPGDLFNQ